MPLLEEEKKLLEKMISESQGNKISELSNELAELIESIQESEDRWLELSDLSD